MKSKLFNLYRGAYSGLLGGMGIILALGFSMLERNRQSRESHAARVQGEN